MGTVRVWEMPHSRNRPAASVLIDARIEIVEWPESLDAERLARSW
jgi:hypothetical protein